MPGANCLKKAFLSLDFIGSLSVLALISSSFGALNVCSKYTPTNKTGKNIKPVKKGIHISGTCKFSNK